MINAIETPLQVMGAGYLQTYFLVVLAVYVLSIPGMWATFEKAGQPGWGAAVPVYNAYLFFRIAGRPGWQVLTLFVPLVNVIMLLTAAVEVAQEFEKGIAVALGLVLVPPVFFALLGFGSARYRGTPGTA